MASQSGASGPKRLMKQVSGRRKGSWDAGTACSEVPATKTCSEPPTELHASPSPETKSKPPVGVMHRAASHLPAMKPRLDRLNAGKVGSKSCNFTAGLDPEDCTFLFLPGPRDLSLIKPWEEPGREELHQELFRKLPQIQRDLRGGSFQQTREAASMLRELAQGSPEMVKKVYESGTFQALPPLIESQDAAVVEEAIMAILHFAEHKDASKRLIEHGVMAALSLAFTTAAERQPKPHFSIQSNICAAYLQLSGGSLKSLGSAIIFAGSSLLRHMLRLARPSSGCNLDGRSDALKLLLMLCERGDVRGKLIDYGAVGVAVENIEANETELFEVLGALFHAFSKMDEAGRQLCGMLPLPNKLDRLANGSFGSTSSKCNPGESHRSSTEDETGASSTPASPTSPARPTASRKSGWAIPDIAEDEVASFDPELEGAEKDEPRGCPGLVAVIRLLDLSCTHITQELALSVVTRLVTRGLPEMTHAVTQQPGLFDALERIKDHGNPRGKKKAYALIEALKAVSKGSSVEGRDEGLPELQAKTCGSVQAY